MMDQELQQDDIDLEDGEISGSSEEEVYTPLQRPSSLTAAVTATSSAAASPLATCHQMQAALDEEEVEDESAADSSSDSSNASTDACLKKLAATGGSGSGADISNSGRRRVRRTVMVRVQPTSTEADAVDDETQQKRSRFKKYNVWTAALQEDALTENMRGCDVTRGADRSVENYDYSLRYRLNGENSLKRRLSNSTDDLSDDEQLHAITKRVRQSVDNKGVGGGSAQRRSVKSRLGHRPSRGRRGSSPNSGEDDSYEPRHILDLDDVSGRAPLDVAREIANKLYEEKDELLVRIVEVLGSKLPVEIYKETQRIEADGGMMIRNGKRRRTPGGVFLFLLKHNDHVSPADQKSIFVKEQQMANKWRKNCKSKSRDRKVEELKKRLSEQEKELPLSTRRKEHLLLGNDLSLENQAANLSNPPPSPVGHEHSPDYKVHAINHVASHVAATSSEKASTSSASINKHPPAATATFDDITYLDDLDDCLDLGNVAGMDFF